MGNGIGRIRALKVNNDYGNITSSRRARELEEDYLQRKLKHALSKLAKNKIEVKESLSPPPLTPPRCILLKKIGLCYENGTVLGNLIINTNQVYLNNCRVMGEVIFLDVKQTRRKGKIFLAGNSFLGQFDVKHAKSLYIEQLDNTRKHALISWYLDFRD